MSSGEKSEEFRRRTRQLGADTLKLVDSFQRTTGASVVARQLARSATSVAANYRAACRARSNNDMIAKLHIVEEECDETIMWLGYVEELGYAPHRESRVLMKEAEELLAMTVASILTLKGIRSK